MRAGAGEGRKLEEGSEGRRRGEAVGGRKQALGNCLVLAACRLLLTTYCLLPTAYRLPPTAYCLLLTAHCLLLTAYCLLPMAITYAFGYCSESILMGGER